MCVGGGGGVEDGGGRDASLLQRWWLTCKGKCRCIRGVGGVRVMTCQHKTPPPLPGAKDQSKTAGPNTYLRATFGSSRVWPGRLTGRVRFRVAVDIAWVGVGVRGWGWWCGVVVRGRGALQEASWGHPKQNKQANTYLRATFGSSRVWPGKFTGRVRFRVALSAGIWLLM